MQEQRLAQVVISQSINQSINQIAAGCATTQPASELHRLTMHVIGKHLCRVSCKQLTFDYTIMPVPMLCIRHMCSPMNVQDRDTADKVRIADRDGDQS